MRVEAPYTWKNFSQGLFLIKGVPTDDGKLRDESLEETANLPDPAVRAAEIVQVCRRHWSNSGVFMRSWMGSRMIIV